MFPGANSSTDTARPPQAGGIAGSTTQPPEDSAECASVKQWAARVRAARKHWEPDFSRMRQDMEFASGIQWEGQTDLNDERYTANLTLRYVNQKVSALYARDPKAIAQRRKRLDYQIWDGKIEGLQEAVKQLMLSPNPAVDSPAALALLQDYTQGKAQRDMVDRVGRTMEILYQYSCDNQMPPFKVQMKQGVRRAVTTGVGYVKLGFARANEGTLATSDTESTIEDRAKAAQLIVNKIKSGEIQEDDPQAQDLKMLANSIGQSVLEGDTNNINERLVFDFPPSTSIIPDTGCRALKGFVGCKWVAQEYMVSVDYVNSFFGTDIEVGGDLVEYNEKGEPEKIKADTEEKCPPIVCLWEICELATKSRFYIVDGWKYFIKDPEPLTPSTNHFWPWFAITFNDIEVEPGCKVSIFPPSDVRLAFSSQKEYNRSAQALRQHRKANAPKYMTGKGWLTDADKDAIEAAQPSQVIEIEGAPAGAEVNKLLVPFAHSPIDAALYDKGPQVQDLFMVLGQEQGPTPASNKSTATAATINEQSRIVTTSSNVDDLDDLLSTLAEAGGEIMLRAFSLETVKRVAGPGATWPTAPDSKENFLNELFLTIIAASSGRPNKALDIANWTQLAPIFIQAGASLKWIVQETAKRLDDPVDMDEAFPILGTPMPMQPQPALGNAIPPNNKVQGQMPAGHTSRPQVQQGNPAPQQPASMGVPS